MELDTFFEAIREGDVDRVARYLSDHPQFVNTKDAKGYTPLVLAAYYDHREIVSLLLSKGAKVTQKDGTGNSALMGACFKGFEEVAKMLIEAGADVNEQNAMGGTCLIYAATFNKESIVRLLLEHGANAQLKDMRGQTALDHDLARFDLMTRSTKAD